MSSQNRYEAIIEEIFHAKYQPGQRALVFMREDIRTAASHLNMELPKNLGDVVYSFRYRKVLPATILAKAPAGEAWIISPAGIGRYRFALVTDKPLIPNPNLAVTKIPDATPGIIKRYGFNDEQAILTGIRYNRLIDIFLGITCYSLQNHLRTTVPGMGQVETDEIYVGVNKKGDHYVVPVQAKGGRDQLNRVQIEQDMELCAHKFPALICCPVGVQSIQNNLIVLFEFERTGDDLSIVSEKHYQLVSPDGVTPDDLARYRQRLSDFTE